MGRLFGTDGVRGIANSELTCELAFKLGQAGAYVLASQVHRPSILVGRDTRISGDMLEAALVAGICSVGARAMVLGVVPTPAIAYLTRYYNADAGVMISASHNPVEYNGIKFFDGRGYKLPDALEDRIESIILDGSETIALPTGIELGRRVRMRNARRDYVEFLKSTSGVSLNGLHVVLDCSNGSASEYAATVLTDMGAKVMPYYCTPDGTDINDNCGSTHPQRLQQLVVENGADVGLAFDGDADRLISVDDHGQVVDGDQMMAIVGMHMHAKGQLKRDSIVSTVMSNMGLELALKAAGINNVRTRVGDRYVLEHMLEHGYNLGGEQSGHIIFLDHNTTGDGILSAIQLLTVMVETGRPLSRLSKCMTVLPQALVNATVSEEGKEGYADVPEIAARISDLERKYSGQGRVFIRASGTEPLVRVMIEGKDRKELEDDAFELARMIERHFPKR